MADTLNPVIVDDVANSNFKVIAGEAGKSLARQSSLMGDDAISHARVINGIREAMFGALVKGIAKVDIETAVAESKLVASDLAEKVAQLSSVVNNNAAQMAEMVAIVQQLLKGAQTTNPETGK